MRAARRMSSASGRSGPAATRRFAAASSVANRCTPWPCSGVALAPIIAPTVLRAGERRPAWPSPTPGTVSARVRNAGDGGAEGRVDGDEFGWRRVVSAVSSADCPPPGGSGSGSDPSSAEADSAASSAEADSAASRSPGSIPGSSKGSRRRRCGSASSAATRMSSSLTESAPRHAACATAVRATTRSARIPSTSKAAHSAAIRFSSRSDKSTSFTLSRAATIFCARSLSSAVYRAANPAGSAS